MKKLNEDIKRVMEELSLKDDDNIGRLVKYKNPTCIVEHHIFRIVGCQKVWGYDENNNYTMIKGYRGVSTEYNDDFGRPFSLNEVEFI